MPTVQKTPFDLPGLTLPLVFKPTLDKIAPFFANASYRDDIEFGFCGHIFTVRELYMMRIMEAVTDKPNWDTNLLQGDLDVTEATLDYIFRELAWKASEYAKTGIVTAFDPGVVKSDTAIPEDLQEELRAAVKPLEDISDEEKDYHPGSDGKVVDLVHPSLFPLVFGRTRVLHDKVIGIDNCLTAERFQWLPCNVEFGSHGECQIASYIKNLHPARHKNLYHIIEQIITRTIPLWNVSLASQGDLPRRISYDRVSYPSDEESEPEYSSDDFDERHEEWRNNPPQSNMHKQVDLREQYRDKGLQVNKPDYEGGAWHIEGQLNERICATAIYYYDFENNIFKESVMNRTTSLVFGFELSEGRSDYEQITQDLGWVSCRMGRLLTFPNILQHRTGHRKILALFLIDPSRRIISTANVPPQREEWCNDWAAATNDVLDNRLPRELQALVRENLEFPPMTMDEAKAYRVELMAERSSKSESENELFTWGDFSLCEH
ncbi:DUF4246 domain-containing protein [Aspergillus foveolatus]|uniref:DUF4246 domain-containing protein n=1 Tax=Aspergillus foveolatus TaxID=210207 RepID=UPI003CCDFE07